MAIRNMLALAVFITFGAYNLIQGEILFGTDIPKLNVTGILGKWYLLASAAGEDQSVCKSIIVEQQSEDNFTMSLSVHQHRINRNNHDFWKSPTELRADINNDTNGCTIIFSRDKTLSTEIFEKVQKSNFHQSSNSRDLFKKVNYSLCE